MRCILQIELKERRGLRSKQRSGNNANPDKDFGALDEVLSSVHNPLVEEYQVFFYLF